MGIDLQPTSSTPATAWIWIEHRVRGQSALGTTDLRVEALRKGILPTATARPPSILSVYLFRLYVGHAARSRFFREAVVWIARTGASWQQWPAEYGRGTRYIRKRGTALIDVNFRA